MRNQLLELKARCPFPQSEKGRKLRPGVFEKIVDGQVSKSFHYECQDCEEPYPSLFVVKDELWNRLGLKGWICRICFEKRLGRKLKLEDLKLTGVTREMLDHMLF